MTQDSRYGAQREEGGGRRDRGSRVCRVLRDHEPFQADALAFRAGEKLAVEDRETEWPGWLWCTGPDGRSSWGPAAYVRRTGDTATALRDYDAVELPVRAGEEVTAYEEASGWWWCIDGQGRSGWLPAENLACSSEEEEG